VNGTRRLVRHGREIKRVRIGHLPRAVFRLTVVATQSTGSYLVSTRRYRGCSN
jgi:hypothetical protein